jgi:anti-anti-sigma factor
MQPPWFYIKMSRNYTPTEFSDVVERAVSKCLRKRRDNIVLDIAGIDMLESMHLSVIIRWLRNLKSLGGELVLSGVNADMQSILSATRIQDICPVYRDEAEFRKCNSEAEVFVQHGESEVGRLEHPEQKNQYGPANSGATTVQSPQKSACPEGKEAIAPVTSVSGEYRCSTCGRTEVLLKGDPLPGYSEKTCLGRDCRWHSITPLF